VARQVGAIPARGVDRPRPSEYAIDAWAGRGFWSFVSSLIVG
jgi:hypothetical protein